MKTIALDRSPLRNDITDRSTWDGLVLWEGRADENAHEPHVDAYERLVGKKWRAIGLYNPTGGVSKLEFLTITGHVVGIYPTEGNVIFAPTATDLDLLSEVVKKLWEQLHAIRHDIKNLDDSILSTIRDRGKLPPINPDRAKARSLPQRTV